MLVPCWWSYYYYYYYYYYLYYLSLLLLLLNLLRVAVEIVIAINTTVEMHFRLRARIRSNIEPSKLLRAKMSVSFAVGDKVVFKGQGGALLRGTIRYIGKVPSKGPCKYLGIQLSVPRGENDGKGK